MNVFLLGMPMSGKTTVGKIVASKLNFIFYDTDELIAKEKNISIRQIIEEKGEEYFRNCEKDIIKKYAFKNSHVISSGGGAVSIHTKEIIKNYSYRVWLKCPIDKLIDRYKPNKDTRPLLYDTGNVKNQLENAFDKRSPFYDECSNIIIDTSNDSLDDIVQEVLLRINEKN